jgi:hypothetical protein
MKSDVPNPKTGSRFFANIIEAGYNSEKRKDKRKEIIRRAVYQGKSLLIRLKRHWVKNKEEEKELTSRGTAQLKVSAFEKGKGSVR